MSLESWDWFVKLSEEGSVTKAAKALELSQQTLSARLATLENEIGAKLVQRGTPLSFTQAGQAFLLYAHEQRQAQQDLIRTIGEVTGGSAGVLKVGVPQMRGESLMPRVIARVREQLPDISFELTEETNRELVRKVERAEIDLAVARFGETHPGVDVVPFASEEIVLAIHEDLLVKTTGQPVEDARALIEEQGLDALRECPFGIGMVEDISGRIAYSELRAHGIKPNIAVISEYLNTLLAACSHGVCAVFAPSNMIDNALKDPGSIVRVKLSEHACYEVSIGTPSSVRPWKAVKVLKETLLAQVRR